MKEEVFVMASVKQARHAKLISAMSGSEPVINSLNRHLFSNQARSSLFMLKYGARRTASITALAPEIANELRDTQWNI